MYTGTWYCGKRSELGRRTFRFYFEILVVGRASVCVWGKATSTVPHSTHAVQFGKSESFYDISFRPCS